MTMQAFNAIATNLRQQFPTLSEAMILQKATEIYQAQLGAANEAARTQIQVELERRKQLKKQSELKTVARNLNGRSLFDFWRKP